MKEILFQLLYNIALLGYVLFSLPWVLWQMIHTGKYRKNFLARLGFQRVKWVKKGNLTLWVHAVSVGETKAVAPFCRALHDAMPEAEIVITSVTETGHVEAKRTIPYAKAYLFLPLDFRKLMKRFVKRIGPDILIFSETDLWPNLIHCAKELRAKVFVLNGKVSARSTFRYQKVSFYTSRVFSKIDAFFVQNELYQERFSTLGVDSARIHVTGNLKFDESYPTLEEEEKEKLREKLGIEKRHQVVVIGSTHDPEEKILLRQLGPMWNTFPNLKVLIVPRHPERFNDVARFLEESGASYCRFSKRSEELLSSNCKIVLVDEMGVLRHCYSLATVAIVGGSFTSKVGGHNVLEPCVYGVPVLFGPYMHQQKELADLVLSGQGGLQVNPKEIQKVLSNLLENSSKREEMGSCGMNLIERNQGATKRTLDQFLQQTGCLK